MSLTSRGARAAARSLRPSPRQIPRRYASHGGDHGDDQGHHGESAHHVADGPASEGFGKGFYITLAAVPIFYLTYVLATDDNNFAKRYIERHGATGRELEEKRGIIHTQMMQEALQDRFLFKSTPQDTSGPDLRYPEQLNHGSPVNVVAGEGTANLESLVAHYEAKRKEAEEARAAKS